MTGIVLAGGENRRMGKEKAFLTLAGAPLIEHILKALRQAVSRIIIVTNSPAAYASYDATLTADVYDKRGPLTGIYSGLLNSHDDFNIVVACDMPFLNPGLLSYMASLAGPYDIVLPKVGDFAEPLHAVYRRGLLAAIERRIKRDDQRIIGLLSDLRVRYVTEEDLDRFDPQRRSFINLNTPKDYEEAICLDLDCRS